MRRDTEEELANIPIIDTWDDLPPQERERRERVLADIRRRVIELGPRRAQPSPERGRLFMPFSALKGYDELVEESEEASANDPTAPAADDFE